MGCAFAAAAPASHATHYRINALVKHSEIAEGEVAGAIGLTGPTVESRAITSSAEPRYCWDTIRGLPPPGPTRPGSSRSCRPASCR